jgi:ribosomal protein S27E
MTFNESLLFGEAPRTGINCRLCSLRLLKNGGGIN